MQGPTRPITSPNRGKKQPWRTQPSVLPLNRDDPFPAHQAWAGLLSTGGCEIVDTSQGVRTCPSSLEGFRRCWERRQGGSERRREGPGSEETRGRLRASGRTGGGRSSQTSLHPPTHPPPSDLGPPEPSQLSPAARPGGGAGSQLLSAPLGVAQIQAIPQGPSRGCTGPHFLASWDSSEPVLLGQSWGPLPSSAESWQHILVYTPLILQSWSEDKYSTQREFPSGHSS